MLVQPIDRQSSGWDGAQGRICMWAGSAKKILMWMALQEQSWTSALIDLDQDSEMQIVLRRPLGGCRS